MVSLPASNEGDLHLLVAYSLGSGEGVSEAIVNAFQAANVTVFERPTQLEEWIDTDALEALQWTSGRPLYLGARIWDHHVLITGEEVRIYTRSALV